MSDGQPSDAEIIQRCRRGDVECFRLLVERYQDFPLGGTDASVIALAERMDAPVVITLDRRHLAAVQPRHRPTFDLLPA